MNKTHKILTTMLRIAILAALGYIVFLNLKRPQEIRQRAAVPGGSETIVLSPNNTSYVVGDPIDITLAANLTNVPIDGFQIIADITGTIPNNLLFQTTPVPGITCVRNALTTTDTGRRLELACITQDPQTPFTRLGLTSLGKITGNVLEEGSMTISYNTALTKITKNQTAEDIVNIPQQATYTFVAPTPTPIPTATPTPTPEPLVCALYYRTDTNNQMIQGSWDESVTSTSSLMACYQYMSTNIFTKPYCAQPGNAVYATAVLITNSRHTYEMPTDINMTTEYVMSGYCPKPPTPTPTLTPSPTPTNTPSATATPTPSPTPTPSATATPTPKPSPPPPTPTQKPTPQPTTTPIRTPTPKPIVCKKEDINKDGKVDQLDQDILLTDFFKTRPANPRSDINRDGIVDVMDYSLLYNQFNNNNTGPCL